MLFPPKPPALKSISGMKEGAYAGARADDGLESPGGGPVAVVKPGGAGEPLPKPGGGPWLPMLGCGSMPPCPLRTPRGFLEKLKRIPPLMLFDKHLP